MGAKGVPQACGIVIVPMREDEAGRRAEAEEHVSNCPECARGVSR